jgi:hypothetical protein
MEKVYTGCGCQLIPKTKENHPTNLSVVALKIVFYT